MKTFVACLVAAFACGFALASMLDRKTCHDDVVWQNFDAVCDRLEALESASR